MSGTLVFDLVFSVAMIVGGLAFVAKIHAEIGFGGRAAARRVFIIRITGRSAVALGVGMIGAGIVLLLPSGYQLVSGRSVSEEIGAIIPVLANGFLVLGALGAALVSIVNAAVALGKLIGKAVGTRPNTE